MAAGILASLAIGAAAVHWGPGPPQSIDFDRDIRPILADACFKCHGPHEAERKAHLRLDVREGLFGPTRDAGDAERDPAYPSRIVAPGHLEQSELARRVLSGDEDERMPPVDGARQLTGAERDLLRRWIESGASWAGHWSFESLKPVDVPAVGEEGWCRNEIDRFVLARMEQQGAVKPSPEADRRTLIRRLSLDLTGLPPSRAEVAAFLADELPGAYERVVDRLLASPRFGEHFAASWLDVARYADSNGFQLGPDRTAWPWRDWVIEAYNSNKPYDQFVLEQIAGDLLPSATREQVLGTAFNRNHPINGEGGRDVEESRIDYVNDRVDATSTAFLGLTLSCARCHDHKYDPLPQKDYYRFFAYFNSIDETGAGDKGDMPPLLEIKDAAGRELKVMVMQDRAEARETHVLVRGAWDQPGEEVAPGTPSALPVLAGAPANRLGLARWLVDAANPLTARVEVNRLWQQVFGQGLVRTPGNFGIQGEAPTHRELLDWMADRLIASGWDVKAMLRLMVTSATYRQSSACPSELMELDPENRLLARAPRYRLGAGVLRDQALMVSGLLVEKIGGPPVKPYHPAGVWEDVSFGRLKYEAGKGDDLYRRSIYTFWRRTAPPANMFDVSMRQQCSVRVIRTNTPLQALILMNDETYAEAAAALAERALREGGGDDESRIVWAFEEVLARPPSLGETRVLLPRLGVLREYYMPRPAEAGRAANAGERPDPPADRAVEVASYAGVMMVILNLDEAQTRE
jgi:hypothetical protein